MPKIKHFFIAFFLGILGIIAIAIFNMGLLKPVTITRLDAGPFKLLYKDHIGAYHKIMTDIEAVETFAKSSGLICARSFGLFMDDPTDVEEARLRSRGGCVVTEQEQIPAQLPDGILVQEVPRSHFMQAEFEGSPRIRPVRVYPKILKEIEDLKLKTAKWGVMEIYDIKSAKEMKTTYLFPLEKELTK